MTESSTGKGQETQRVTVTRQPGRRTTPKDASLTRAKGPGAVAETSPAGTGTSLRRMTTAPAEKLPDAQAQPIVQPGGEIEASEETGITRRNAVPVLDSPAVSSDPVSGGAAEIDILPAEREDNPTSAVDGDSRISEPRRRVPIPEEYEGLVPKEKKTIDEGDLDAFNKLLVKYGLWEEVTSETQGEEEKFETQKKTFGEADFFEAARDLEDYAISQGVEMTGIIWDMTTIEDAESNPVNQRMSDMVDLFLHLPKIQRAYMQIHARKMEEAYPYFEHSLQDLHLNGSVLGFETRDAYLDAVDYYLKESMREAAKVHTPDEIDRLGFLSGYQMHGAALLPEYRREVFAITGADVIIKFTDQVITDALKNKKDIKKSLQRELLKPGGVGFILMRTHIGESDERFTLSRADEDLDVGRKLITERKYTGGACPAMFKMDSVEDPGQQRPLAYELAAAILRYMPGQFLV